MYSDRPRQGKSTELNPVEESALREDASERKSEMDQYVDRFLKGFDEDYQKSISKREREKHP